MGHPYAVCNSIWNCILKASAIPDLFASYFIFKFHWIFNILSDSLPFSRPVASGMCLRKQGVSVLSCLAQAVPELRSRVCLWADLVLLSLLPGPLTYSAVYVLFCFKLAQLAEHSHHLLPVEMTHEEALVQIRAFPRGCPALTPQLSEWMMGCGLLNSAS